MVGARNLTRGVGGVKCSCRGNQRMLTPEQIKKCLDLVRFMFSILPIVIFLAVIILLNITQFGSID
jgi:hypothetical protein